MMSELFNYKVASTLGSYWFRDTDRIRALARSPNPPKGAAPIEFDFERLARVIILARYYAERSRTATMQHEPGRKYKGFTGNVILRIAYPPREVIAAYYKPGLKKSSSDDEEDVMSLVSDDNIIIAQGDKDDIVMEELPQEVRDDQQDEEESEEDVEQESGDEHIDGTSVVRCALRQCHL
jgi:hypothetical protein